MNVYHEDLEGTQKKLTVEISGEEIAAEQERVAKEFARQVRLPGFRPGKAPEAMVRKRHAKDIEERMKQAVLQNAYQYAVKELELEIFGLLDVAEVELEAGKDAEAVFTVEVQPQIVVPEYKGLAISAPAEAVTDEEAAEAKKHMLEQRAEFKVVDKAAAKGDYVKHSFKGTIDGQPVAEITEDSPLYTEQSATWEEAGSEHAAGVPVIAEALVGMSAGDKTEVTYTFPDDHAVEALQGKTATYAIEVEEVREKVIPEMNEDLLKSFQVESEAELDERLRQQLSQRKSNAIRGHKRQQILHILTKDANFAIPGSAVDRERDNILREFMQERIQQGANPNDFQENEEELLSGAQEGALGRLRAQYILLEIAKKEKIELKPEDMQQTLMQEAMATRTKPDKLAKELRKDEGRLRELQRQALFNKTLEFLLEQANVTEVEPEKTPAQA